MASAGPPRSPPTTAIGRWSDPVAPPRRPVAARRSPEPPPAPVNRRNRLRTPLRRFFAVLATSWGRGTPPPYSGGGVPAPHKAHLVGREWPAPPPPCSRSPVPVAVWVAIWVAVRTLVWVLVNPPCTDGCKGGCTDSANVGPSALRARTRRAASTPEKSAPDSGRSGKSVSGGPRPAVGGGISAPSPDTPGHIPLPWSWSSSPVRLYLPQPGDTRPTCRCTCAFVPHRPPGAGRLVRNKHLNAENPRSAKLWRVQR